MPNLASRWARTWRALPSGRRSVGGGGTAASSSRLADRLTSLSKHVQGVLEARVDALPFHNWSHTDFVRGKAVQFARERHADALLVEAAALVHDLNYLVEPNSSPQAGGAMRRSILTRFHFEEHIERIEQIIDDAHMEHRRPDVDVETACLSDADTLYKVLPITPVLFSRRYLVENGIGLDALAKKIVGEQIHKLDANYFFYDQALMDRYRSWAEANLGLWSAIYDAMGDPEVAALVDKEVATAPATPLPTGSSGRGASRRRPRSRALARAAR